MAETDLQIRRKVLSDLTGLPIGEEAPGLPGAAPADDLATLPAWLARAERGNLALQAAETRIRMAEAKAHASAGALAPTLDLVARVGQERLTGDGRYGSASTSATNHAIGVQLSVPLYTGGMRSAQQTEAQALIGKANAERDQARQQIGQQTQAAWLDLAVGEKQIDALAAALEASRARLDATRTGLRAGDRTTLDACEPCRQGLEVVGRRGARKRQGFVADWQARQVGEHLAAHLQIGLGRESLRLQRCGTRRRLVHVGDGPIADAKPVLGLGQCALDRGLLANDQAHALSCQRDVDVHIGAAQDQHLLGLRPLAIGGIGRDLELPSLRIALAAIERLPQRELVASPGATGHRGVERDAAGLSEARRSEVRASHRCLARCIRCTAFQRHRRTP